MTNDQYIDLLAGLRSDDSERVRTANRELVSALQDARILTDSVKLHPDLALADAEERNSG